MISTGEYYYTFNNPDYLLKRTLLDHAKMMLIFYTTYMYIGYVKETRIVTHKKAPPAQGAKRI